MKKRKKIMSLLLIVILIIPCFIPLKVYATEIKLNKTVAVMEIDSYMNLSLSGTKKTPSWKSSDTRVVKVSKKGTAKAVGEGEATVTATLSKKSYTCQITVCDNQIPQNSKYGICSEYDSIDIYSESFVNIMIKDPKGGKVSYSVSGDSVSCYWGEFDGNMIPLWFSINCLGSSKVYIFASYSNGTSDYIEISVNVVGYETGYKHSISMMKNESNSEDMNTDNLDENNTTMFDYSYLLNYYQFPLYLYSSDKRTYLGKVTSDTTDAESIWNPLSTYGSKYSTNSIWNTYGTYGSSYSSYSAFNDTASNPPVIIDNFGREFGYLTSSRFKSRGYNAAELFRILSSIGK